MKRFLSAFVVLILMLGTMTSATFAQRDSTPDADASMPEGENAYARGFDAPAYLFSKRGDIIASMVVTGVERDWQDYDDTYYTPAGGKIFTAVTFEITMETRGGIVVSPYGLTLFDGFGYVNTTMYVEPVDGSELNILTADFEVASGETVEFTAIFEVFEGAPIGYLMWTGEYGFLVMVDLTEEDI